MAKFSLPAAGTTTTTTGDSLNTANADVVNVAVYSSSTSTAVVVIEQSMSSTAPYYTVATVTNPTSVGEVWTVPRTQNTRVRVNSISVGTVFGEIEAYNDSGQLF